LKLFAETGRLLDELVLEDYPQDLTMLDDVTAAAITSDLNRSIHLVSVRHTLAKLGNIFLSFEPDSIAGCNGLLAVTCMNAQDCSVKLMTRDGEIIKCFSTGQNGLPLFTRPRHVTANMSGNMLFVDERVGGSNEIVAFTTDTSAFRWRHLHPLRPTGGVVKTDAAGNVYMCSRQQVQQVAPDGKYIRQLPLRAHAPECVEAISFRPGSPLRFVTTADVKLGGDINIDCVRLWTFE
jgi:hypothetical protein